MRFIAKELYIANFRKLKDLSIKLGKNITVFSGINGVGKSNIISLIAMSFGASGTRIVGGRLFPHFDEYFIITEDEFNKQKSDKYLAYLKISANEDCIQKRLGLKNDIDRGRGVRVLPRATNHFTPDLTQTEVINETKCKYNIGDSKRVPIPTIFISLSRLFPMGEATLDEQTVREDNEIIRKGIIDRYIEWYNEVLPNSIDVQNCITSKIKKNVNSNGRIHVELVDSNARTQSMGEDNLGTIISALVDFYYLKEKQGDEYNGGILCIDEIDASLHPSAQIRLFDLLDKVSEDLSIQVFITSHSITLLEKIIKKQNRDTDKYKLVYLLDPRIPRIKEKIASIEDIKSDMFDDNNYYKPIIKVYCEDEETKFIFEQLISIIRQDNDIRLPEYIIFPMSLGHTQLERLRDFDPHFESVVMLVDGDSKRAKKKNVLDRYLKDDIKGLNSRTLKENVLSLPTFLAPESYYYYILKSILNEKSFWKQLERLDLSRDYTSQRLKTTLDKVKLDNEGNISNDKLKNFFHGERLSLIKEFIKDTQVLMYYYDKYPDKLLNFKKNVQKVFDLVEKKVKASL